MGSEMCIRDRAPRALSADEIKGPDPWPPSPPIDEAEALADDILTDIHPGKSVDEIVADLLAS